MTANDLLLLALAFLAGAAVGTAHFVSLRRVVDAWTAGRTARAVALSIVRWVVLVVAALLLARQGAMPLLAGLAGLLVARVVVVRSGEGAP